MDPAIDLQEPDEARPAKRARLEAPLSITEDVQEEIVDDEDDWDDIYGSGSAHDGTADRKPIDEEDGQEVIAPEVSAVPTSAPELSDGKVAPPSELAGFVPLPPDAEEAVTAQEKKEESRPEVDDGVPADAVDDGDNLVAEEEHPAAGLDEASTRMLEETADVEPGAPHHLDTAQDRALEEQQQSKEDGLAMTQTGPPSVALEAPITNGNSTAEEQKPSDDSNGNSEAMPTDANTVQPPPKPSDDPDFLAAASAQKQNGEAEWQFDPSDAESSSSDDSSSDSDTSDSSSDGGYELLDPATAAKILMSGDGDNDDGDNKKGGGDHQPRTANEVAETIVPKPDVVVTEEMKITFLGTVDRVVENMALIKGATPGEYQVLESGSVLCNEKREVIGAVGETFGRVQEPMYSVAFTNAKEIEDAGVAFASRIFYVDSHSTFVFTQPLKNLKGTDASNIHDEEVGEDELEFSDDEREAEFKRMRKAAKRGGRGGLSRSAFNEEREGRSFGAPGHDSGVTYVNGGNVDALQQFYGSGGLSYDDDEEAGAGGGDVQEEFYSPLRRPENLSQMMGSGGQMPPPRPQQGGFERGRGRGRGDRGDRGRGRGDRGRGRGRGRGDRGGHPQDGGNRGGRSQDGGSRGGYSQDGGNRGGYGQDRGGRGGSEQQNGVHHRGNAHSFPDRHNNGYDSQGRSQPQHSLPPRPPQQASPPQQDYQQPQAPSPQSYQFGGYTFQYGNQPPPPQQQQPQQNYYSQPPQTPGGSIPAGAYVNPAFFQNQNQAPQQPQWSPQAQQGQSYGGWQQQGPGYGAQQQYAQPGAAPGQAYGAGPQPSQQDLAALLRSLGGQQQQPR